MMKTVEGKIKNVTSKVFMAGGSGRPQTELVDNKITIETRTGDVIVSRYTKPETNLALTEGDEVSITYEPTTNSKGQVNNKVVQNGITKVNVSTVSTTENSAGPAPTSNSTVVPVTTGQHTDWAAKDISMEVSGLLQAIIQHHGLDSNTEHLLRTALTLKRQVAADVKNGAFTADTTIAKKILPRTPIKLKKEVVESTPADGEEDDFSPFEDA